MNLADSLPRTDGAVRPREAADLDIGVFGVRGVPSTYGGFETFLTYLLPRLVEAGHSVTIYCRGDRHTPLESYLGVRRVPTWFISRNSAETLSHGLSAAWAAARRKHDVILVCNVANSPFTMVLRLFGMRVVLNTDGQEWRRSKWGLLGRTYFRLSAYLARYSATALVSDGAAMASIYRSEFAADSTVIPYCWNTLESSDIDEDAIMHLGLERERYVVVGGRHVPENNLVEIVQRFIASDSDLDIVVLGGSTYPTRVTEQLKSLARADRRVHVLGHIASRVDYKSVMARSAMYLHGHSVGGTNPALIEAMGSGCAIAALDGPFNREVLGDSGLYFNFNDESISEIVRLAQYESMDELRNAARHRARSIYDGEAIVDAYETLLHMSRSVPKRFGTARMQTAWAEPDRRPT